MSAAREEMLGRIRHALRDVPGGEQADDIVIARGYRMRGGGDLERRLDRFADRIRDYHADILRIDSGRIAEAVAEVCAERGIGRVVVPAALPSDWRPADIEVVEDGGLDAWDLDAVDGVVTGCAVAIAETGTLVLDGQGICGRRVVTLVPDHHICIVRAEQVVELVPEAVAAVGPAVAEGSPITLISGPSASSDIELKRVEGFHGPRHLVVFLVTGYPTE